MIERLIIAGGRDYMFIKQDLKVLDELGPIHEVVSGCARGADAQGELWAFKCKIPIRRFPAKWDLYGKSAGYIRNELMAQYATACALFPGGKGTEHMFQLAKKYKLQIFDFRS